MMCPDLCNGMGPGFSAKPMGDHRIIAPWWSLANQVKGYQYISVIIKNIQKELVRTFSVRVLNFLNLEVAPIDFQTSLPSQKKSLRCKQQHMFQAHQDQSHWSWLRKTDQELPWLICKASKTIWIDGLKMFIPPIKKCCQIGDGQSYCLTLIWIS